MSKFQVTLFVIAFHVITFGAVFMRIDTFPLTWVPMYSQFHGTEDLVVPIGDRDRTRKGFEVTTASGEVEFVTRQDLNIPKAAFRRIYYERSFGKGPPKHLRERANLNGFSDALFDQFYPDPATSIDWHTRILDMMNTTLERTKGSPDYIIQAVAISDFTRIPRDVRRQGDLSDLNITTKTANIKYQGSNE